MEEKLYDLTFLKTIAGDDLEGLRDIINKFLKSTPDELDLLEDAIDNKNRSLTAGYAHKLKANVKFFHIKNIFEKLREIENQCSDETIEVDFNIFKDNIRQIRTTYQQVFQELSMEEII